MPRVLKFRLVLFWTLAPIALAYVVLLSVNLTSDSSGKAQLNGLIALLVPATLLAFLTGLAAFLPGAIAGPDKRRQLELWASHFVLTLLASIAIMVVCGIITLSSG